MPFLPELVESLERHGHLSMPEDVRGRLLVAKPWIPKISPATVDRLLQSERLETNRSVSTTRAGNLLKHQIHVRTFADWDDVSPGLVEADTIAHCAESMSGQFLNTLVLTDISTGWIELLPLMRNSAQDVITGTSLP